MGTNYSVRWLLPKRSPLFGVKTKLSFNLIEVVSRLYAASCVQPLLHGQNLDPNRT